jgi:hypothetical protein
MNVTGVDGNVGTALARRHGTKRRRRVLRKPGHFELLGKNVNNAFPTVPTQYTGE